MRSSLFVSKIIIDFLRCREATFSDNILLINDNPNKYIFTLYSLFTKEKKTNQDDLNLLFQ